MNKLRIRPGLTRFGLTIVLTALVILSGVAAEAATTAETTAAGPSRVDTVPIGPSASEYTQLVARHSGQCLDVQNGSLAQGANIQQWPCWNGPGQRWRMEPTDNGYFKLVAAHTGMCLDVVNGSTEWGANVQQWPCWVPGLGQQWRREGTELGYYKYVNRKSGLCLDVLNASTVNGANVQQWDCWGGYGQQWLPWQGQ
jgi:hypothetical protein